MRELMLGTRETFGYQVCSGCGSLSIESVPEDLERYYGRDYYTNEMKSTRGVQARGSFSLAIRQRYSRWRMRSGRFVRLLSGRRYGRFDWLRLSGTHLDDAILEVGCGSGRLLVHLRDDGFSDLTGIDERAAWPEAGIDGIKLIRAKTGEFSGAYRLVMAHHSFEHMSDPRSAFAALARLVAPGGMLLLRVPIADSWACAHYAQDWVQLDAPRHLHIPTRQALVDLAQGEKLEVERVIDDSGPFQIWGSELYRRGLSLAEGGRMGRDGLSLRERIAARVSARKLRRSEQGDQACFYLRKPASSFGAV